MGPEDHYLKLKIKAADEYLCPWLRSLSVYSDLQTLEVEEIYQPVMETRSSTVGVCQHVVGCASTSGRPRDLGRKSQPVYVRMYCNYIFSRAGTRGLLQGFQVAASFFFLFETNNDQRQGSGPVDTCQCKRQ